MRKFSPHVLVLLCEGNIDGVKSLIEAIKEEEMRSMARIVLYGSNIDESVRDVVHADAFAENEQDLFDIVNEIVTGIS
jgi:methanogenic corrinoid protein MtbC1